MANTELTLEGAEDLLCETMQAATTMYNQLDSGEFQRNYEAKNGKARYQDWRARAITAYEFKKKAAEELQVYIKGKFGIFYKSLTQVQLAIKERGLSAPDWMSSEESNAAHPTETQLTLPIKEDVPAELAEIELSLQSQKKLDAILGRLLQARKDSGMSQEEVAEYFGFHATTISYWERGRTPVTLLNIFRLAAIYELDPLYILTGENDLPSEALEDVAKYLEMGLNQLKKLMES